MSGNQINQTTNRVMEKTVDSCIQNFSLMNGLTTVVDTNAKIIDLLSTTSSSDTQTLLTSSKTIMDYAIARGLASVSVVQIGQFDSAGSDAVDGGYDLNGSAQPGSVKFNYNQQYSNTPSSTASITLYQVDLTYYYVYDTNSTNNYTPKANSVIYNDGAITNSSYIAELNNVLQSYKDCESLIQDIAVTYA